jgi:RecB family exonuclease
MQHLEQNLYITYSNQRARDLNASGLLNPLDRVITLDTLIEERFEKDNFQFIIDDTLASSILYKLIQEHHIEYFSYLDSNAESLKTIFDFMVKCHRNDVVFDLLIEGEKLQAVEKLDKVYLAYKSEHNLSDISDVEQRVCETWSDDFFAPFNEVFVDNFTMGEICFVKSKKQEDILTKLAKYKQLPKQVEKVSESKMIRPSNEVFDSIDEVKTALKIARKLLEEGIEAEDILIVASDIAEYAPLYKLFLDEYGLKGYSSVGTPLSSFYNTTESKVQSVLQGYNAKIRSLEALYKKLGLVLSKESKENIKAATTVGDEKIGIEITEPNQVVGLSRVYEHIIFIGTDINHFPPKSNDNFLYSYDDDLKYFYANNYFTSSQTQLNELKRLAENLYIITASYSDKRELMPSILIDSEFDDTIDISDIKSVSQLALDNQTKIPDDVTRDYYKSIVSQSFTAYDGDGVQGLDATHLSASQINKYISCPLSYLYSNKVKVQAPKQSEEGFDVMEQGSLMHLCYELFGKNIKEKEIISIDKDELYQLMYEISIEAYKHKNTMEPRGKPKVVENIHHKIFLSTLQAGLKDDRSAGLLAKFVDYYIQNAKEFNYFRDTEFEKEFALDSELNPYTLQNKDDKNYFIKGVIDRFDNLKNQINIIDYKSKKVQRADKQKQKEVDTQKDIQLALYILYASQAYPDKIYDAHLLSFKGNDYGVKFATLSNDNVYDEAYQEDLKKLIFDTKQNIEDGKFGFNNSDEKMCGYCDIKYICHESVLGKSLN